MNTLLDVKAKVRELCADPQGQWLTDSDLLPLVNQVYQQQISVLAGTCSPYITKLAEVPAVPAGTTSLQKYQQGANVPLYGLMKPRIVEAKPAGTPDSSYRKLREYDVLPNMGTAANGGIPLQSGGGFEWRSFVIWLLPFTQAMDIRVRGDFMPPPLVDDTDMLVVHPNMAHATAYGVAALAGSTIGNAAWETTYGTQAENALNQLAAQLVRQQQTLTFRVGRMNRGRGRR